MTFWAPWLPSSGASNGVFSNLHPHQRQALKSCAHGETENKYLHSWEVFVTKKRGGSDGRGVPRLPVDVMGLPGADTASATAKTHKALSQRSPSSPLTSSNEAIKEN